MTKAADIVPHMEALRVYARYLTRNPTDADDLLSQALVRAVEKIDRHYQEHGKLRAWLRAVMFSVHVDSARRRKFERIALDSLRPCAMINASQEDVIALSEVASLMATDMRGAIIELAEARMHTGVKRGDPQLVRLTERVGMRPGTVRSREHRFRGALAAKMGA